MLSRSRIKRIVPCVVGCVVHHQGERMAGLPPCNLVTLTDLTVVVTTAVVVSEK